MVGQNNVLLPLHPVPVMQVKKERYEFVNGREMQALALVVKYAKAKKGGGNVMHRFQHLKYVTKLMMIVMGSLMILKILVRSVVKPLK